MPGDTRYVAMLRGINVGRNKRIAMAELRSLLTGLDLAEVRTILQSGNAVFSTDRAEKGLSTEIEQAIADRFAMQVSCVVRSASRFNRVVQANPWPEHIEQGSKLMVLFLSAAIDDKPSSERDPQALDPASIKSAGTEIYQWCPDGALAAPPVGTFVEKHWPTVVTARNWNTVAKIAAALTS